MKTWKQKLKSTLVLLFGFAALVLLGQQHIWSVRDFAFDLQAQLAHTLPADSRQVVVVSIDEQDYRGLFNSNSPLDDSMLRLLIERILDGNPAVLGVDIRTEDRKFASLRNLIGMDNVVWARAVVDSGEDTVTPGGVLGASPVKFNSGVAVLPDDSVDSTMRRYQRRINTSEGVLDTFVWAIVQAHQRASSTKAIHNAPEDFSRWDIRYTDTPTRPGQSASEILAPGFDWNDSISGKIVLLGGRYDTSDKHKTPYEGEMDGVDVLANVIETEINYRSQPSFTWWQLFGLGAIEVPLLMMLFHLKSYRFASLIIFLFIASTVPVYILGLFQFWMYCSLIALGMLLSEGIPHFTRRTLHLAETRLKSTPTKL